MINPLTFIGNSSIIDANRYKNATNEQKEEIKNEFAKLFIEKVYMNNLSITNAFETEENDESSLFEGLFSREVSSMLADDMFREQMARKIIEEGIIDFDF
jgi:ABC-type transporter MlaC component